MPPGPHTHTSHLHTSQGLSPLPQAGSHFSVFVRRNPGEALAAFSED